MNRSSELYLFDELFRQKGFSALCGSDEAGRGPLAGPVCAAAVILDPTEPLEGSVAMVKVKASPSLSTAERVPV